ncbi:Arylsulfotransferase-domain-containing protein [Xylariomycetidae sp. FL0641]|nr:Arylsulfotransferase-domain-containing protein [Xylariomycetidae sp. FL0641]
MAVGEVYLVVPVSCAPPSPRRPYLSNSEFTHLSLFAATIPPKEIAYHVAMHGFHFALTALLLLTQGILADIALTSVNSTAYQQGSYGGFPNQTFRSSPVVAPLLDVKTWDKNSTDDAPFIVLNGQYGTGNGPLIYRTDDLSLVYANTTWNESLDVNIQSYNGQDYFTYWEGVNTQNTYYGYWSLYDSDYNLKYNFSSQNLDHLADMHDMVLTSNGTALMVIYDQVYPWNTTVVGGKENDTLEDALFQEVDVESGDVLFTWRLSDHYDINDTMVTYEEYGMREGGGGFDFGHINAISKTDDGNYLASFRHLCSVLLISPDGDIIWNLGGKRNNFTDLSDNRATDFCFQHDARFANAALTEITMFDNHQMSTDIHLSDENDCSRALHLKLDYDNMTAEVIDEYYHPDRIVAGAMGGYQTLGNGNKFVAWGFQPTITEHTDAGDVVLEIHMGPYGFPTHEAPEIYRAKKVAWVGRPPWKPSIAGTPPNGTDRGAYVSWNGATEYTKWAVVSHAVSFPRVLDAGRQSGGAPPRHDGPDLETRKSSEAETYSHYLP